MPERLAAALAGRYRIEREIGAGGAAIVYLAEDLKHHRRVAMKVLRPQVAAALGPERFEDEIQIAARLHHPHILGVHDSGEADGFLYYVMPYVDGQSLRERLQQSEPLVFARIARILAEVADALAHAHAAGIVHRDIKPENILLSGKHVVVTDFGIAKAISDASERKSSTSLGIALGTPAYMAPEQASSDPSLDHRADLYALGVVGYEMICGHPPFSGTGQQILASHLTTKPEPVGSQREGVPPALAAVVMRSLAKAPDDRWKNAEEMQAALEPLATSFTSGSTPTISPIPTQALPVLSGAPRKRLAMGVIAVAVLGIAGMLVWKSKQAPSAAAPSTTTASAVAAPAAPDAIPDIATDPSIAVLPFENMSSDKEQQYFSDGISEELLNLLAKIEGLRVTARTSSFQFRDKEIGIQEIARKLHVAAVLEGSVRKSGDTVRITAQLIRAKDGTHLWSETYDRKLDDVFKVQDEIAERVVSQLKLTLLSDAPKSRPVDPAVYPDLLRADAMYGQNSPKGRLGARDLYLDILKRKPDTCRAWSGLARVQMALASNLEQPMKQGIALAREAANKALACDPSLAIVHTYLGNAYVQEGNMEQAAASYERAVKMAPSDPRVLANAGQFLASLGRIEEALKLQQLRVAQDPAMSTPHSNVCVYAYQTDRFALAERECRAALDLSPDTPYITSLLAEIVLVQGRPEEALEIVKREPDESTAMILKARVLDVLGRRAESDGILGQFEAKYATLYPSGAAEVYAARGDEDHAFEWLDRAIAAEDPELTAAHTNRNLRPLHDDPRWLPFLRKIGRAPEQLAKFKFDLKLPD